MRPVGPDDFTWSIAAIALFGFATSVNDGHWSFIAFYAIAVAFVLLGYRFLRALLARGEAPPLPRLGVQMTLALLASGPIIALCDPKNIPEPGMSRWWMGRVAQVLSLVLLASYAPYLDPSKRSDSDRQRNVRFALFAAVLLVAGIVMIRVYPSPAIDVWTIQMRGAEVMLEGRNPYTFATVPDTDPETDFTVPYVYPPFSIYIGTLGKLLGNDVRYGSLFAIAIAGFALRYIARRTTPRDGDSPSPTPSPAPARASLAEDAPALSLWLWSPVYMIVARSWIDPCQVMLVSLALAAFVSGRLTLAAVVLGVGISSKQSMFWIIPLAMFVLRFDVKRWVVLGIAALVPVLPFVVWDFRAMKYANFEFMTKLPPRHDALCVTAWVEHAFGAKFPSSIAFVLAAVVVAAACLRLPAKREEHQRVAAVSFARALAATYFVFFFFNRWAFANYYFSIAGFTALAAAASMFTTGVHDARGTTRGSGIGSANVPPAAS